jgi:hypothetical protein
VIEVELTPARLAYPVVAGVKLSVYATDEVLVGTKVHVAVFAPFVETAEHPEITPPFLKNVIEPATLEVALMVADAP